MGCAMLQIYRWGPGDPIDGVLWIQGFAGVGRVFSGDENGLIPIYQREGAFYKSKGGAWNLTHIRNMTWR